MKPAVADPALLAPPGASLDLSASTDLLRLLADPTRVRLLNLLEDGELSVAELVRATRLPQSRVSTHLGKLREGGLVRDRRVGSSSLYSISGSEETRALWERVHLQTADPLLEEDRRRLRAAQLSREQTWAESVAGQMERHYSPGRTWEAALHGLLGLVRLGDVLDVASGDGALAELIAPRARSITCLDVSAKVVAAGRARLAHLPQVDFRVGDMHALPFPDASFDAVLFSNTLTYADDPARALAEAARVLRPGGALAGVTLRAHDHREAARGFDHVQLGFAPAALRAALEAHGFEVALCEVTSREKRPPHFEIVTLHATRRGPGYGE